jgi:hypothetical protein
VVTSLWSKSVRKDIVDDVILGKHTMIGAIVVLVPEKVERCHFIVRYTPLSANWLSIKVIWGKAKDYGQLSHCQLIMMTFNGKVKCRIKSISTSPRGGIELSH